MRHPNWIICPHLGVRYVGDVEPLGTHLFRFPQLTLELAGHEDMDLE